MKMAKGNHKVFADGSGNKCQGPFTKPNEVYINGKNQSTVQSFYQFDEEETYIKLAWKNTITSFLGMFCNCGHILELNLSHFNTSQETNIQIMFQDCHLLTSIDLSNIDISKSVSIAGMFYNCYSLISLDLSRFETSICTNFGHTFCNCSSLKEINISHFNTQNVNYMDNTFNGCTSLISPHPENIDMTKVIFLDNMFLNCNNLVYVNIRNYKQSKTLGSSYYFNQSPKNLVVCTEDEDLIDIIENHECHIVNCLGDWYNYRKKIIKDDNKCTDDCTLINYKYEYNYECYTNCQSGTYIKNYKCFDCNPHCKEYYGPYTTNNINCISCSSPDKVLKFGNCVNSSECLKNTYYNENINQHICKCDLKQCFTCSIESFNKNLCTKCEEGYYPFYDDKQENYPYLNCTKAPIGYFFDNEDSVNKLCYPSCETCETSGNETEHNCKKCKYGYNFEINFGIYKNCYMNCSFYHYYDSGISYCTKGKKCMNEYDKLIEDKSECVSNCTKDDQYKFEFRKHCYKECPSNSTVRKNITELEGFSLDKKYFCKPICNEEAPFEILYTQECLKNCSIKYLIDKSCILNFQSTQRVKEEEIQNKEKKG